jgi:hypothetical protein
MSVGTPQFNHFTVQQMIPTPSEFQYQVVKIWFCTQVERLEIQIERIDTKEQLADLLTKGLPVDAFCQVCKCLMGW